MSTILGIKSFYLVTFLCTDRTLTTCELPYISQPMLDNQCEILAGHVLKQAQTYQLKETVLTYCTESPEEYPAGIVVKNKTGLVM